MNATANTATLDVSGDTLEVRWTGSVWVAPTNGSQHARIGDAMRVELEAYYLACGEDLDEHADEIDSLLANIQRS